jgi:hypothetical protein
MKFTDLSFEKRIEVITTIEHLNIAKAHHYAQNGALQVIVNNDPYAMKHLNSIMKGFGLIKGKGIWDDCFFPIGSDKYEPEFNHNGNIRIVSYYLE